MAKRKRASNPESKGGLGTGFEVRVVAAFTTLMLSGGPAPCLGRSWPITSIQLQTKRDGGEGYDMDDFAVTVSEPGGNRTARLLCQVKRGMSITEKGDEFGDVILNAWDDFTGKAFRQRHDGLALITCPPSRVDVEHTRMMLERSRKYPKAEDFFRDLQTRDVGSKEKNEKLRVFRKHLEAAKGGDEELTREELFRFVQHFHLLGYDLDAERGSDLAWIHVVIQMATGKEPHGIWTQIHDQVQFFNQHGGWITRDTLPPQLLEFFPDSSKMEGVSPTLLAHHDPGPLPKSIDFVAASLLGGWNTKSKADMDAAATLAQKDARQWLSNLREFESHPDFPFKIAGSIWRVKDRLDLLSYVGGALHTDDLDEFTRVAISVLGEDDPQFELPPAERYMAAVKGKGRIHSDSLRKGIADTLAMLAVHPDACPELGSDRVRHVGLRVLAELLSEDVGWLRWASLLDLLPTLAEAAPDLFLRTVEGALLKEPCPFDELFAQEGGGITGRTYIAGMLWALETVAWAPEHLASAMSCLAMLADRDPGGNWGNRPSSSMRTILLPWRPQTKASIQDRIRAVEIILRETPGPSRKLLLALLPKTHDTTSGTHRPQWHSDWVPLNVDDRVLRTDYSEQVRAYGDLAVDHALEDFDYLLEVLDHVAELREPALGRLLDYLDGVDAAGWMDEQRHKVWESLNLTAIKHTKYSDTSWALPPEVTQRLRVIADRIAPEDPRLRHASLFGHREFDLIDKDMDYDEFEKKLRRLRKEAIGQILDFAGFQGVIDFAGRVEAPYKVGSALAGLGDDGLDGRILTDLAGPGDGRERLADGYVRARFSEKGWEWFDGLYKAEWSPEQTAMVLDWLPFTPETWDRADDLLSNQVGLYWQRVWPRPQRDSPGMLRAAEALLEHGRPAAALGCLNAHKPVDVTLTVRALLGALGSDESPHQLDDHYVTELIKALQQALDASAEDLQKVEFAYLKLLDGHRGIRPVTLEKTMATSPKSFCECIQHLYRSEHEAHDDEAAEPTEAEQAVASQVFQLLHQWQTPPGLEDGGTFSKEKLVEWLAEVKEICTKSGHLDVALLQVGEVLFYARKDPDEDWIFRGAAEVLNDPSHGKMRDGYSTKVFNSRGAHLVNPTGDDERVLAERWSARAQEMEELGLHRFARTLRGIANGYDDDAERVRRDHERDDD